MGKTRKAVGLQDPLKEVICSNLARNWLNDRNKHETLWALAFPTAISFGVL